MKSPVIVLILLYAIVIVSVYCNSEGDALIVWKSKLVDPNNALQSWHATSVNPCFWFRITCNVDNSVVRIDLGNAGLSGPLVPDLGNLTNLLYLQVENNGINGSIPSEIGNLKHLISLGLQQNQLSGSIPATLGNLKSLKFLRLNNNQLSGSIPAEVIQLNSTGNLLEMNVSNNYLEGTVQPTYPSGKGQSNKRTSESVWTVGVGFLFLLLLL